MAVYVDMGAAQFENVNELRKYPFAEGSSLMDRRGRILPADVVADVRMAVPADMSIPQDGFDAIPLPEVRLSSVHISPSMVSACFISRLNGRGGALSVTVARDNFVPYAPCRLEKLAGTLDMGGMVTFGNIDFPVLPETYFLDDAVVHQCCIAVARPPGLRSIVDARSGERVSGDVEIEFSDYIDSERRGDSLALSLRKGADRALAPECALITSPDACGATPIRTINGVRPDKDGNIVLWFH